MFPIPPTMAEAILDLNGFQTLYSVLVVVPSAALSYLHANYGLSSKK
jgi:hypothetical protein